MQGVGDGALEALGLAGDLPLMYVCCDALFRSGVGWSGCRGRACLKWLTWQVWSSLFFNAFCSEFNICGSCCSFCALHCFS